MVIVQVRRWWWWRRLLLCVVSAAVARPAYEGTKDRLRRDGLGERERRIKEGGVECVLCAAYLLRRDEAICRQQGA